MEFEPLSSRVGMIPRITLWESLVCNIVCRHRNNLHWTTFAQNRSTVRPSRVKQWNEIKTNFCGSVVSSNVKTNRRQRLAIRWLYEFRDFRCTPLFRRVCAGAVRAVMTCRTAGIICKMYGVFCNQRFNFFDLPPSCHTFPVTATPCSIADDVSARESWVILSDRTQSVVCLRYECMDFLHSVINSERVGCRRVTLNRDKNRLNLSSLGSGAGSQKIKYLFRFFVSKKK